MVVFEVPGDGVAAGVAAFGGEGVAELEDQCDGRVGGGSWAGVWSSGAGLERGVAFGAVARDESRDPAFGDAVVTGDLGLGAALQHDSGDDQASFRHPPASSPHRLPMSRQMSFRCVDRKHYRGRSANRLSTREDYLVERRASYSCRAQIDL